MTGTGPLTEREVSDLRTLRIAAGSNDLVSAVARMVEHHVRDERARWSQKIANVAIQAQGDVDRLIQSIRDELEPPIDRVRSLHSQADDELLAPGRWCPACGHETPCPTIRALNSSPTGERT